MRGSIRRRGSTYTWYISVPDPVTGERRQRSKGGFRTKRECQEALTEALARLREGTFVVSSPPRSLGAFLMDEWLPAVRPPQYGRPPGPAIAWPWSGTSSRRWVACCYRASRRPI
jgi:Arm DNA-binding domain